MGNRSGKHGEEKTKKAVEKVTERTSGDKVEQDNNDPKATEGCQCKTCTCNPCRCGKGIREKKETKCSKCDLESCDCKVEDSVNEVTKEIENLKVKSATDETVNDELANKLKDVDENEMPSVQPEAVVEIKAL